MSYDRPAPQKVLKINIVILYRLYYPVYYGGYQWIISLHQIQVFATPLQRQMAPEGLGSY